MAYKPTAKPPHRPRSAWFNVVPLLFALAACSGGEVSDRPAAPTDVTATAGPGYIELAWTHDGVNVTGFEVFREVGDALTGQQAEPYAELVTDARWFVDTELSLGQTYAYSVVADGGALGSSTAAAAAGSVAVSPGILGFAGRFTSASGASDRTLLPVYLFIDEADWPEQGSSHPLTVTGPEGFYPAFDDTLAIGVPHARFAQGFWPSLGLAPSVPPAGDYVFELTVDGKTFSSTATYDPENDFEPAAHVTVVSFSAENVEATWTPVAGVVTQAVSVRPTGIGAPVAVQVVKGSSATFEGLELSAEEEYYVEVLSYSYDWETGLVSVPEAPEFISISQGVSATFSLE